MKIIRILVSSPGDVHEERVRARDIIQSLRRRYARRFLLKPILWESLPLQPDMSFQQGIDLVLSSDKGVDISIFILWSRFGTPQEPSIRKPDGGEYLSGMEREFDLMMQAREQSTRRADGEAGGPRPHILVYRRLDQNSFDERLRGHSTHEQQELITQKKLVESFIAGKFHDAATGANRGAYFDYANTGDFSNKLREHLENLLDQMAGGPIHETLWDTTTQGPPYLGLHWFERRHADVFFGREEEILEARSALRKQACKGCAFLLVSGASGSGKSSLVRAGVLPAIIEYELDDQVASWRTLIVTPSELAPDPVAALMKRLIAEDVLPELFGDAPESDDVVEILRRNPEDTYTLQFKPAFARAAQRKNGAVRLLLVVDQLEELFTSATISAADRTVFFSVLEAMARGGSVWILATVRVDFYQQVQNEPALVRMKSGDGLLDVLPPAADAIRRLVEEPAHRAGLRFEKTEAG